MNADQKPLLAITMGDPAGCGPEIIAKVAASNTLQDQPRIVCIGNARVMEWAFSVIRQPVRVHSIRSIGQACFEQDTLDVLDLQNLEFSHLKFGQVQAIAGAAAYEYIVHAIDLALQGQIDGVVTAPINKAALHLAGYQFDGHTEIFAGRTNSKKVAMLLASGDFRVSHVSTHCSLKEAIARCQTERILDVIRLTHQGLKRMGLASPRIGVAGLNPHSGEGGLFGDEDREQIQPAIDRARTAGLLVYDRPLPPDTAFVRMAQTREFDAVVAQYHDQGHIAAKIVDFWSGVNITLGLPIVRTSVDHGTAFDIVGTGTANPHSLLNAIHYARVMARNASLSD